MRKPLAIMKKKVAKMLGKEVEQDDMALPEVDDKEAMDMKLFIASAHDTQVVNMMGFLEKDFDFAPYASQVTFELKYSVECLASDAADENCFGI